MLDTRIAVLGAAAFAMAGCATNQDDNATDAQGSAETMSTPAGDTSVGTGNDTTTGAPANTTTGTMPPPTDPTNSAMTNTDVGTANETNSVEPPQ